MANNQSKKKVKKNLSPKATISTHGLNYQQAGIYMHQKKQQFQPEEKIIKTDIAVAVPENHYGRIAPRSGMSWKNCTDIGAGVIDADYRGEIGVVMFNHSNVDLFIKEKDLVAQ